MIRVSLLRSGCTSLTQIVIHVGDVNLDQTPDPNILEWAAENDRIVVTHDKSTM